MSSKTPTPPGGRPSGRPKRPESPRPPLSGVMIWILLLATGVVILMHVVSSGTSEIDYSFFVEQVRAGNVAEVRWHGDKVSGEFKQAPPSPKDPTGKTLLHKDFTMVVPPPVLEDAELMRLLEKHEVKQEAVSQNPSFLGMFAMWVLLPVLVMMGLLWFWWRRARDQFDGGILGSFAKSPAKRYEKSRTNVTFNDVANLENAKGELQEVVDFLKNPEKFQRLGGQIPKGILLMGPPGTGKTLLARAVAGEAGVPFYSISGSEFIQMFVGVGASRVRDMFKTAKENAPCILFIDEIDAVGRVRGAGLGGGHDEREQTLNQILSEMDGFQPNESVIVLAASNRPDVLDPALLRPGRFDRHVTVDRPTREGRLAIFKVHTRSVPVADDVDLEKLAAGTVGLTGADIRNLVNEAALLATRLGKEKVEMVDFEQARDKVLMGPKREEVISGKEKEMTAYHEAGHALLAWLVPEADPLHKVTIIPRGRSLGATQLLPLEDRHNIGEKQLYARLTISLGGRAAEQLVFNELSAGAEQDLKQATDLSRRMVSHWGMSPRLGPVAFHVGEEHPFLGREIHELRRDFSEHTARVIDEEIQRILGEASQRATELLSKHRPQLDCLAQALVQREVLSHGEVEELLASTPATVSTGPDGQP